MLLALREALQMPLHDAQARLWTSIQPLQHTRSTPAFGPGIARNETFYFALQRRTADTKRYPMAFEPVEERPPDLLGAADCRSVARRRRHSRRCGW
jgi:hypothetical protein